MPATTSTAMMPALTGAWLGAITWRCRKQATPSTTQKPVATLPKIEPEDSEKASVSARMV